MCIGQKELKSRKFEWGHLIKTMGTKEAKEVYSSDTKVKDRTRQRLTPLKTLSYSTLPPSSLPYPLNTENNVRIYIYIYNKDIIEYFLNLISDSQKSHPT